MKDNTVEAWKDWVSEIFEASRVVNSTEESIEVESRYYNVNVLLLFKSDLMEKFVEHMGFENDLYYIYEEKRRYGGEDKRTGDYKYVVDIGSFLVEIEMVSWNYRGYNINLLSKEPPHELKSSMVESTLSEEETRRKKEAIEAVRYFENHYGKQRLRHLFNK